jgi:hypothetical protein
VESLDNKFVSCVTVKLPKMDYELSYITRRTNGCSWGIMIGTPMSHLVEN